MDERDRRAVEYLIGELSTMETRLFDHISATSRWLMATLFAANGGAAATLVSDSASLPGESYALAWFAGGIALSIIAGMGATWNGYYMIRPVSTSRAKGNQALMTGDTTELDQSLPVLVQTHKMKWWMYSPSFFGISSLVCWIVAAAILGAS